MNLEQKEQKSDWVSFIEKFATNQIKVYFDEDEKGNRLFNFENIFDTKISVSNKYGFLSVNFGTHSKRDKFLMHTKIEYDIERLAEFRKINTKWLNKDYPCRVFFSDDGKILSFYDSIENKSVDEIFTVRVTVFRNVISSIIQLKIDAAFS